MTPFAKYDDEQNWCWLATDVNGNVGLFESFGDGALLPEFCESFEEAELVFDYIEDDLLSDLGGFCNGMYCYENDRLNRVMPLIGQDPIAARNEYIGRVLQDAACGVFVYHAMLSTYRPVGYYQFAFPSIPRKLEDLPSHIRKIVARIKFSELSFPRSPTISTSEPDWRLSAPT